MSDLDEGARLKRWFAAQGWDASASAATRLLYTLTIRNLLAWEIPEGLLKGVQRVSFKFDLITGLENADSVLELVAAHSSPEVLALYHLALADESCGIVRAKSPVDGSLVGTIIITRPNSALAKYIPVLKSAAVHNGGSAVEGTNGICGILAPVVPSSPQAAIVLQGLALLGIRQNKAHRAQSCVLCWVQGEERDVLLAMGFDVLDAFEEVRCSAERVS